MRLLSRYLLGQALAGVAVAGGVTLSAVMLVDVVEQLRSVGARADLSLTESLELTLLRLPQLIEQTLSFIVLAGVMLTFVRLSRRSEITVLRAAGVSPAALALPAAALGAALGVFVIVAVSPAGSLLLQRYEAQRAQHLGEFARQSSARWLIRNQGNERIILQAAEVEQGAGAMKGVLLLVYRLDPAEGMRLSRRVDAPRAEIDRGALVLYDAVETTPTREPARFERMIAPAGLGLGALDWRQTSPEATPVQRLPAAIRDAKVSGLESQRYETRLHEVLSSPLLLAAMALIAVAFSLRLQRLGGVARWLVFGITAGLAAFFFGEISAALAAVGAVPPLAAAWGPPLAAFFAACAAIVTLGEGRA